MLATISSYFNQGHYFQAIELFPCNFLIINRAVMVPACGDPMDAVALQSLAGYFPELKVIAVPCQPLVHQYGSLHCMTMQFPEGALRAAG